MRYSTLDSWRGIAALFVALSHFNALGHFYGLGLVRNAYLFVDFFFVLSGFVIAHAYFDRLVGFGTLGPFMLRRFGRVWPLHAFTLLLFVAFPLSEWVACLATRMCGTAWPFSTEGRWVATVVSNLLLVHSLGLHASLTWNWPSWSISTEYYAYLLFGLLCITFRPALPVLAVFLIIISAVVVIDVAPTGMETTFDFGYFRCVMGFFCGFLVFRIFRARSWTWINARATSLELASILLVGAFVSAASAKLEAFLAPVVFAWCVLVFANEAGLVSRLLKTRPMLKLGEWSYSIYMVHAFVLIVLFRGVQVAEKLLGAPLRVDVGRPPKLYFYQSPYLMDLAAVLYLAIVIAIASFSYRLIEKPARAYFNQRASALERRD